MKYLITYIFIILIFIVSCNTQKKETQINLKWNISYPDDTIDKNITGLKWCLSYLGATIANDSISKGITYTNSTIHLDVSKLGFTQEATDFISTLNANLKLSDEYKKNGNIDLGRFMAFTIGSSYHYYKIVNIPQKLEDYHQLYNFDSMKGYINNSSISLVDRIISFTNSTHQKNSKQAFIATEIDSITKEILEYETVEIMANGQLKFGVYDRKGILKSSGDSKHTKAGKPAKCIWCHEVNIQPLFRDQKNEKGYLPFITFNDSLEKFNASLQKKQNFIWKNQAFKDKQKHTAMEISYVSFMEPSLQRLSSEWSLSVASVKEKLKHLKTHRHHEFDFLGDLYHRKDIDILAPWKVLEVPTDIREESFNEINYLK